MQNRPVGVLLGTRPEAIKLVPILVELRARGVPTFVVSTGQHRDLVDPILGLFDIRPDHDLAVMRDEQTLDYVLASVIAGVGALLDEVQPRALLVQGDTTSMLGGSLAAFHHRIPLGHVEAGLRSGSLELPFPEELNRRVASIVARWHFAPTERAADNLRREGITEGILVTGNTVVDALRLIGDRAPVPDELTAFVEAGPLILATAHRRESWDGGIARIADALASVLGELPDHRIVFVTHPNPVASEPVREALGGLDRARIVTALDYPSFVALLRRARLAVTDSGGVQEEGPTLGIPVLVTRAISERPEGIEAGAVGLVGTDPERIRAESLDVLRDPARHDAMARAGRTVYGDGRAAERVADRLLADLGSA